MLCTIKTKIHIANVVRTSNLANYEPTYYEDSSCNYLDKIAVQMSYTRLLLKLFNV